MSRWAVAPALVGLLSCTCSRVPDTPVGGRYDETTMTSFVPPCEDIGPVHSVLLGYADSQAGKEMLPGRVLAWSWDISLASGCLEQFIEDGAAQDLEVRTLTMMRILVSYAVPSPFALDINAQSYQEFGITGDEIDALRGVRAIDSVETFSRKEKLALRYAHALSQTPVVLEQSLLDALRGAFTEKEIVALAALTAKVNFWARLLEGLRIKPAGYTDDAHLHLQDYDTFSPEWRSRNRPCEQAPELTPESTP